VELSRSERGARTCLGGQAGDINVRPRAQRPRKNAELPPCSRRARKGFRGPRLVRKPSICRKFRCRRRDSNPPTRGL
jgi:hypothetical protein